MSNSAALLLIALALASLLVGQQHAGAHVNTPLYDLLITNARIVDGSGNAWFRSSLDPHLPAWLRAGGLEEAKKRLADKATRERAINDTKDALKRSGFKDYSFAIVASYEPDKSFNGKSIAEITKEVRHKTISPARSNRCSRCMKPVAPA